MKSSKSKETVKSKQIRYFLYFQKVIVLANQSSCLKFMTSLLDTHREFSPPLKLCSSWPLHFQSIP